VAVVARADGALAGEEDIRVNIDCDDPRYPN
jgi:hypothetical protein